MTKETLPKRALSVADFCRAYSIGRTTFYERVKAGEICILKVGTRTLVSTAEAERWLNSLPSD